MTQTSFFGETIDLRNTAPAAEYKPLPEGWYTAIFVEGETQPKDWGVNAKVKFKITEGEYANRVIFDNLTIVHRTNQQANDISQRRLRAWCDAINIDPNINGLDPFMGRTVRMKIKIDGGSKGKDGKDYPPSNRIETFAVHDGMPAGASASPAYVPRTAAAPAPTSPTQSPAAQTVTHAAAAPGKKVMPWEQRTS